MRHFIIERACNCKRKAIGAQIFHQTYILIYKAKLKKSMSAISWKRLKSSI